MRSWNWNLNFSVTKEYKIRWSTTASITVATVAIMTDADPFWNTTKKAWPAHDPSAEIPRDHGEIDLPWQDHLRDRLDREMNPLNYIVSFHRTLRNSADSGNQHFESLSKSVPFSRNGVCRPALNLLCWNSRDRKALMKHSMIVGRDAKS